MNIIDDLKNVHKELTFMNNEEFKKVVSECYGISNTEIKKCTREEIVSKCVAIEERNYFH